MLLRPSQYRLNQNDSSVSIIKTNLRTRQKTNVTVFQLQCHFRIVQLQTCTFQCFRMDVEFQMIRMHQKMYSPTCTVPDHPSKRGGRFRHDLFIGFYIVFKMTWSYLAWCEDITYETVAIKFTNGELRLHNDSSLRQAAMSSDVFFSRIVSLGPANPRPLATFNPTTIE